MPRRFKRKVMRLRDMTHLYGLWPTIRWSVRRILYGRDRAPSVDVFRHYAFVIPKSIAHLPSKVKLGTISWFVPDFNVGSGGHLNIFRTIWHLEQKGYESHIVIVRPQQHQRAEDAEQDIRQHFFPLKASVSLGYEELHPCEFAIATGWDTAYTVRDFSGAMHKVYFVQDYEPWFYCVGSESLLAENTYRMGFYGITAGDWLSTKLHDEFEMQTTSVGFGVEHERYRRLKRREPHIRRVFFYSRPPTPRRAFELGLLVLNQVWRQLPETQFVLAGWDTAGYHIPFPHLACGTLSLDALPDLYSQCDVALVLSLTNLSLLPLELMACGCTVVSNRGPNVEWLLDDTVVSLSDPTPEALSGAIVTLLADDVLRTELSQKGEEYAGRFTWDAVAQAFEDGLIEARNSGQNKDSLCAV